jgi:hypothetical protein
VAATSSHLICEANCTLNLQSWLCAELSRMAPLSSAQKACIAHLKGYLLTNPKPLGMNTLEIPSLQGIAYASHMLYTEHVPHHIPKPLVQQPAAGPAHKGQQARVPAQQAGIVGYVHMYKPNYRTTSTYTVAVSSVLVKQASHHTPLVTETALHTCAVQQTSCKPVARLAMLLPRGTLCHVNAQAHSQR